MDVSRPEGGWDKLTNQPLDLHLLPGHHATLLQSPAVEYLAHELSFVSTPWVQFSRSDRLQLLTAARSRYECIN